MSRPLSKAFTKLTWEDLDEWAGERITGRGKSYIKNVQELCVTPDGELVATVRGTEFYSTLVGLSDDDGLFSECTCPYSWGPCKHAVAVILAYLDAYKKKQEIPLAEPEDDRLKELDGELEDEDFDYDEDDGDDDDDDDDNAITIKSRPTQKDMIVQKHLETFSKKELVEIVMSGKNVVPGLRRKLTDNEAFKQGNISKLISSIKSEIKRVSREPAWTNHWNGEGELPDYGPVKKRLKNLLTKGHADAVVELGDFLMERGIDQIEQSNDEGETSMEISSCMEVIFKALKQSALSGHQRILWIIDIYLRDGYGILDDIKDPIESTKATVEDWNQVVDELKKRLDALPKRKPAEKDDCSSRYHRKKMVNWLLVAFKKSKRENEVIGVLENETAEIDCYVSLVDRLIQSGQSEKAKDWAFKGYTATREQAPGIARDLEEILRDLANKEKDYPLAAAYFAFEFFNNPDVHRYTALKTAATKAKVWDDVRKCVLAYLETGDRPDKVSMVFDKKKPKKKSKKAVAVKDIKPWPLPGLPLSIHDKDHRWSHFPDTSTLIDIAIDEKRYNDVLHWYRFSESHGGFGRDYTGDKVAQVVCEKFPNDAIEIWKKLVAKETIHANQAGYQTAGGYLKKIRKVSEKCNKMTEWNVYFASVREANKRRPRMIDVLNKIEGRRTLIVE